MQGNLNIGTIGQKLEAARKAKGISISEVGQDTKIMSKFIAAMEADDFGALSAPVYAKSFIRMYAQYLGLDADSLVTEYLAQHMPRSKKTLSDDVRQKLVQVDQVGGEAEKNGATPAGPRKIFSHAGDAVGRLSESGLPLGKIAVGVVAVIALLIVVASVKQCDKEDEPAPSAVGGAAIEYKTISSGIPDVYVNAPAESE